MSAQAINDADIARRRPRFLPQRRKDLAEHPLAKELRAQLAEVSRLKQAAEQAQRKAEDIAQLPMNNPDPLLKIDLLSEKILFFNPAAYNRYPELLTEALQHPLLHDIAAFGAQAFNERKSLTREVQIGDICYQQVVTPNLLGEGRVIVVYHYNITRLKQVEEFLRRERVRAEAASRAKSDFLANMSHELRTPMNGVLGMAGLLKDSALLAEQREIVTAICSSGEALLQLLNDILDLSKIEAGELRLEEAPFQLQLLVQESVRLFEPLARQKNLSLTVNTSRLVQDMVVGDAARLRQILTNLLGNALKFTEQGGVSLDISVQPIQMPIAQQDAATEMQMLCFRVEDSGIGIAQQHIDRIFYKFTQADESPTRRFGGTGLGLAISKLLVETMRGHIGVHSTPGVGSCFWFSVPLSLANAQQAAQLQHSLGELAEECAADDFSRARLLVIDDHPINLIFARKALQKMGVGNVDTAEDGISALNLLERGRYDLVITDCQMPEMDGYAVARAIRQRESRPAQIGQHRNLPQRMPIIAMTANAMVGDRETCLLAGMDDYVSKPVNSKRLRAVLRQWLPAEILTLAQPIKEIAMIETTPPEFNSAASSLSESDLGTRPVPEIQPPVDFSHLTSFIGDDPEEKQTLVTVFIDVAAMSLQMMENAAGENRCEDWARAAHKLKGSAANFGAQSLADFCRKAEENANSTSINQKIEQLQDIREALAAVQKALHGWLGSHLAA